MMAPYKTQTAENGLKELFLEVVIGATGAVGAIARQKGFGALQPAPTNSVAAIVRNSAGRYTLNLDQQWQACLSLVPTQIGGFTAVADGGTMVIISRNLTAAQPNIVVEFRALNSPTTPADPTSGCSLQFRVSMKDSTV